MLRRAIQLLDEAEEKSSCCPTPEEKEGADERERGRPDDDHILFDCSIKRSLDQYLVYHNGVCGQIHLYCYYFVVSAQLDGKKKTTSQVPCCGPGDIAFLVEVCVC